MAKEGAEGNWEAHGNREQNHGESGGFGPGYGPGEGSLLKNRDSKCSRERIVSIDIYSAFPRKMLRKTASLQSPSPTFPTSALYKHCPAVL